MDRTMIVESPTHNSGHSDKQYVRISPPLAFKNDKCQAGRVVACSFDDIVLMYDANESEPPQKDTYNITLGDNSYSVLSLAILPLANGQSDGRVYLATPTDASQRAKYHDMLAHIRKTQHIDICVHNDVESEDRRTGFGDVSFAPQTFPELDWEELDITQTFMGHQFRAPILIPGMTGGTEKGAEIARRLAKCAEHYGIPMGMGSQSLAISDPEHRKAFQIKRHAPRLFLIGNIGSTQLVDPHGCERCLAAIDMIEADALAVHINVLQELIQVEGDRHFKGILEAIGRVIEKLTIPLLIKEVGCGIDLYSAEQMRRVGVRYMDIGGRGGTSWGYIEGLRSDSVQTRTVSGIFRDWGIPTAYSLAAIHRRFGDLELVATGGIRDGQMIAKAIALGANMVGVGLPMLKAALESERGPFELLESLIRGLKISMLCTGSRFLAQLKKTIVFGSPYQSELQRALKEGAS